MKVFNPIARFFSRAFNMLKIKANLQAQKVIRPKRTLLQEKHFGTFSPVTPFRYNHKFAR